LQKTRPKIQAERRDEELLVFLLRRSLQRPGLQPWSSNFHIPHLLIRLVYRCLTSEIMIYRNMGYDHANTSTNPDVQRLVWSPANRAISRLFRILPLPIPLSHGSCTFIVDALLDDQEM
jgi:hypothetical protein